MKNINVKRSAIGRVTVTFKTEVNDSNTLQITSEYLRIKPTLDPYIVYYIDDTVDENPGLRVCDNDLYMSDFIVIGTETGRSLTIAKESVLMMEIEMFTVESLEEAVESIVEAMEEDDKDVH